jgi:hypothetical protein
MTDIMGNLVGWLDLKSFHDYYFSKGLHIDCIYISKRDFYEHLTSGRFLSIFHFLSFVSMFSMDVYDSALLVLVGVFDFFFFKFLRLPLFWLI